MLLSVDGHVAIALIIGVVVLFMWYRGWPLQLSARDGEREITLETKEPD